MALQFLPVAAISHACSGIHLGESCPSSAVVCYRRANLPRNDDMHTFLPATNVYFMQLSIRPLILLADISIALEGFDFPSKARGEVLALKILDLRNPTLSLQARTLYLSGQSANECMLEMISRCSLIHISVHRARLPQADCHRTRLDHVLGS